MRFRRLLGKLRGNGGTPGGGSSDVLTASDFTYLGAFALPRDTTNHTNWDSFYGQGLTFVDRTSEDPTNPKHLIYGAFPGNIADTDIFPLVEVRIPTSLSNPGNPLDLTAYTQATVVKEYGSSPYVGTANGYTLNGYTGSGGATTYGSVDGWRRLAKVSTVTGVANASTPGWFGLHWDATDSRLYWAIAPTYGLDSDSWHFGYSTLDYAAGTGSGVGPYRLSGQGPKSGNNAFVAIPSAYATNYLSGKRLAIGSGGYGSLVATGDASAGPSLTAIDAISAAEQSTLANTPLVGYWPWTDTQTGSNGRMTRPTTNGTSTFSGSSAWGSTKWTDNDAVGGAVWIDTGTKRGVVFFMQLGLGNGGYYNSNVWSEYYRHYWAIYDPNEFAPVSGAARYNVQPTSVFERQYAFVDYAGSTNPTSSVYYTPTEYGGGITSITSTNGVSEAETGLTGAHVTFASAHGRSAGNLISIRGNSQSAYNGWWRVGTVVSSTELTIYKSSELTPGTWTGATGTGGAARSMQTYPFPNGMHIGATYDASAKRLYVATPVSADYAPNARAIVSVWGLP